MSARRPLVVATHWVHPEVREHVLSFANFQAPPARVVWSREEVLQRAVDADAVIACMADHIDDAFLRACPRLRIVAATLKGYDNFDATACARRGVWLTIVPTSIIDPTAELALGLTLGLLRRIAEADHHLRTQGFAGWRPAFYGTTLQDATVGILGMGALGHAIAKRLRPFGPTMLYADEHPVADERALDLQRRTVDELFRSSDVVLVALPLIDRTRGLVDHTRIGTMSSNSVLVNVGRGSVVDEHAVALALEDGRLAGYAADVHAMEDWAIDDRPRSIDPILLEHPRTLLTPHLGSAVDTVRRAMSLTAADQVRDALTGATPAHAVAVPDTP